MPRKKTLSSKIDVLETNILLHEPLAFLSSKENDIVAPTTVFGELDDIKNSKKDIIWDAHYSVRATENLFHGTPREYSIQGLPIQGLIELFNKKDTYNYISHSSYKSLGECYV
jgi:PhoH-like ATPase